MPMADDVRDADEQVYVYPFDPTGAWDASFHL